MGTVQLASTRGGAERHLHVRAKATEPELQAVPLHPCCTSLAPAKVDFGEAQGRHHVKMKEGVGGGGSGRAVGSGI